jgi:hypothetical protein
MEVLCSTFYHVESEGELSATLHWHSLIVGLSLYSSPKHMSSQTAGKVERKEDTFPF